MKRSERLERINAINHGVKNLAGANLSSIYNEYTIQLNQLEQLQIYRQDYMTQLNSRMDNEVTEITPREMQDYRYFFQSLDDAIEQQASMVRHLEKQVEECQKEWLEKHQEVKKFNIASANLRRAEAYGAARAEQAETDELGRIIFQKAVDIANH